MVYSLALSRRTGLRLYDFVCAWFDEGEEEERAASTKAGPEAFAPALAANNSNQSPEAAAKTAAFFDKQIEVLEVQRKHLEAEHEYFEAEWCSRLLGKTVLLHGAPQGFTTSQHTGPVRSRRCAVWPIVILVLLPA
jgi:hypothetical protein